jgi:hypothetical protein
MNFFFLDKKSIQTFLALIIFFLLLNYIAINFFYPISILDYNIGHLNNIIFKIISTFFFILIFTIFIKEEIKYELKVFNKKKIYNFFVLILFIAILLNISKILIISSFSLEKNINCFLTEYRNIWLNLNLSGTKQFISILSVLFSNIIYLILFFVYIFKNIFSKKEIRFIYIIIGIVLSSYFLTNISRQILVNFFTFYLSIVTINFCFMRKSKFSNEDYVLILFTLFLTFFVFFSKFKCVNYDNTYFQNELTELKTNYEKNFEDQNIDKTNIVKFKNKQNNIHLKNINPNIKHIIYYLYAGIDNSLILVHLDKDYNEQKLHTYYIKNVLLSDFDFIFKKANKANVNSILKFHNYKLPGTVGYIFLLNYDYGFYIYLILIILFFLGYKFSKKIIEKNFFLFLFTLIFIMYFSIQSIFFNTPFTINFRHFTFIFIALSFFLMNNFKISKCP